MWTLFFRCASCQSSFRGKDLQSFPLCSICQESLIDAPELCSQCSSPLCSHPGANPSGACLRPWMTRIEIHSYSSRYLLIGNGYATLKKWKRYRGPLFDRQVLKSNSLLLKTWNEFNPDGIVAMPQQFRRAWSLGGNRAERIAEWVGCLLKVPVLSPLKMAIPDRNQKRQAERGLSQRLENPIHFFIDPLELNSKKRILLVDDFMTSGHTLHQAAKALKSAGLDQIHAFCLGIRAHRINSESSSNLLQSTSRSIAISEKQDAR